MKKGLFAIVICLFVNTITYSQENSENIFSIVEHQPSYVGGNDAMFSFIHENLAYPSEAKEKGISGTIFVGFVVSKDGTIKDISIVRGIEGGEILENEAMRVVSIMPKWNPGIQDGEKVNVKFNLPFKFQLDKGSQKKKK